MKNLSKLLVILIAVSLFSCKSNPKDLIVKKWKFDVDAMKKMMEDELSKKSEEEQKQGKAMMEMYTGMLGSLTMEFKADGAMEVSAMGQNTKSTWSINDEGNVLSVKEEGKDEQKMKIKELTASKLILTPEGKDGQTGPISEMVLVSAN